MKSMIMHCDSPNPFPSRRTMARYIRGLMIIPIALSQFIIADFLHAATLVFSDTFEDGTTNKWIQPGTYPKCTAVSSAADGGIPQAGSRMLRCGWYADPVQFDEVQLSSWPYTNEFLLRFWIRLDENVTHSEGAKMLRLGFGGPDWTHWNPSSENTDHPLFMYWEVGGNSFPTFWGSSGSAMNHTWSKIEAYIKHDTNGADGILRVWVNDVKVWEVVNTNTHTDGAHWYPLNILSNWSGGPDPGYTPKDNLNYTYWDDFEIFSDSTTGTAATGSMADGTISASGSTTSLATPKNLQVVP